MSLHSNLQQTHSTTLWLWYIFIELTIFFQEKPRDSKQYRKIWLSVTFKVCRESLHEWGEKRERVSSRVVLPNHSWIGTSSVLASQPAPTCCTTVTFSQRGLWFIRHGVPWAQHPSVVSCTELWNPAHEPHFSLCQAFQICKQKRRRGLPVVWQLSNRQSAGFSWNR